ncbi:conserved Plasmodium protein, unknown function [Plasmodium sp. gorilla clade G2]|uniref:Uncharacterized protein n=1 Tax=Plasmodium gaboni TaxID=647221 RepID=A0ABY1URY6_9APIC|nr:conserved Plasmodium protein, unknown function [Plasmodium sp. gorilla clade G2]SOV16684.1 conserved Plasmodium protein, unknown function [Plasmodium gaboni]SOV17075.1 conserved Plasmodium protein, unknown function [Plasmodium sp. gorilla clade G2]
MESKHFYGDHMTHEKVRELLDSSNVTYEQTPSFFNGNIIYSEKPTRKDNLKYRIEYLKDGTAIYYKRRVGDFKKFFCCF